DLKLSYAGDEDQLSWVDPTVERIVLRPVLSDLVTRLASVPLNYLPDSLPLRLNVKHRNKSTDDLPVTYSTVSLDKKADLLSLAMGWGPGAPTARRVASLLPARTPANAVVALSETGLNRVLDSLCTRGHAFGSTRLSSGAVDWRWVHVAVRFTDKAIQLTGQL